VDASLLQSAEAVRALGVGPDLTNRIADLERALVGRDRDAATTLVTEDGITSESLLAALAIKALAGQINVVVHALGILVSLPYLLEDGEVIECLSLGAGNSGCSYDLETNRRIAEFKIITWRGADADRKRRLLLDLFHLASSETAKRRQLYVVGKHLPLRFLTGNSNIQKVLSKDAPVLARFNERHAVDGFVMVGQYWSAVRDRVELVDLQDMVPAFGPEAAALLDQADTMI
jgi:hypothetical protein